MRNIRNKLSYYLPISLTLERPSTTENKTGGDLSILHDDAIEKQRYPDP
jgi:hypothetical protein